MFSEDFNKHKDIYKDAYREYDDFNTRLKNELHKRIAEFRSEFRYSCISCGEEISKEDVINYNNRCYYCGDTYNKKGKSF